MAAWLRVDVLPRGLAPANFWRHRWWTGLMDGGRWRWLRLEHLDADLKALADELKAPADELQT